MHHLFGELNPFNLPRVISPWYNHPKSPRLEHTLYTIEHKTGLCKRTAILGMSQNQCTTKEGLEVETNGFLSPLDVETLHNRPIRGVIALPNENNFTSLGWANSTSSLSRPLGLRLRERTALLLWDQPCCYASGNLPTITLVHDKFHALPNLMRGIFTKGCCFNTYTTIDTRWICRVGHVTWWGVASTSSRTFLSINTYIYTPIHAVAGKNTCITTPLTKNGQAKTRFKHISSQYSTFLTYGHIKHHCLTIHFFETSNLKTEYQQPWDFHLSAYHVWKKAQGSKASQKRPKAMGDSDRLQWAKVTKWAL